MKKEEKVILGKFGQVWAILGKFRQVWASLGKFGQVWASLGKLGQGNILEKSKKREQKF